jgi:hypothetical protein
LGKDLLWANNNPKGGVARALLSSQIVDFGTVPVAKPKPGVVFSNGLPRSAAGVFLAKVTASVRRNSDGELLQAVAAVNMPQSTSGDVYSLSVGSGEVQVSWQYWGSLPVNSWSIASYDGNQVFVGTTDGRIFRLDDNGSAETMQMTPFVSTSSAITQLWNDASTLPQINGHAIAATAGAGAGQLLRLSNGSVLTNQGAWVRMNGPTPASLTYYDMAVEWGSTPVVYVASDSQVYVTIDAGFLWQSVSDGLPKRPHCSRLRIASEFNGSVLYLSTYGRSAWRGVVTPPQPGGGGGVGGGVGPTAILPQLSHGNKHLPFT